MTPVNSNGGGDGMTNWTARLFVIGAFWWMATAFVAVFMDGPLAEYGLRLALGLLHLLCAKACESSGQQQDP
jgi:hypothetical protein